MQRVHRTSSNRTSWTGVGDTPPGVLAADRRGREVKPAVAYLCTPTDAHLCSDSLPDAGGAAGRPSVPVLPLSGIPGAAPPPPTRLAEAETGAKKGGLKFGFQKPKRRSGSPRRSAAEDAAVPEQRV